MGGGVQVEYCVEDASGRCTRRVPAHVRAPAIMVSMVGVGSAGMHEAAVPVRCHVRFGCGRRPNGQLLATQAKRISRDLSTRPHLTTAGPDCLASARECMMDHLGHSCRPSRGEFRQRGGQDRSGRRRAASMASWMSGRGSIRIDDSGRSLCSDRVWGRFVRTTLRPRTRPASSFVSHAP